MIDAALARSIRLVGLDVDGVMTDGGIIYPEDQTEPKVFFVRDGFAIRTWTNLGLRAAVIRSTCIPAPPPQPLLRR